MDTYLHSNCAVTVALVTKLSSLKMLATNQHDIANWLMHTRVLVYVCS